MSTVIVAIVVLAVLVVVATFLKNKSSGSTQDYPYRQTDDFLSKAELSFFGVLRQAVGDNGIVFAKVCIADVLAVNRGLSNSRRQTAFNKIQSKHFDFVICASDTAKPIVAVELDDSSHKRKSRTTRDTFVNCSAEAASLPLLRIPAKNAYPIAQIREQLAPYFEFSAVSGLEEPNPSQSVKPPACPKCGSGMVRRDGKNGALAGKEFWGCERYPRCRSVLPIVA